jgi:GT2 family glycosyltransferase
VDLTYCVVNTNGRDDLLACLEAIAGTHPPAFEGELVVLDNASTDGSAEAVREWARGREGIGGGLRLIELEERSGKAANDSQLLSEAQGELCLLLNEDSELRPRAVDVLVEALRSDPGAVAAGAQLLAGNGAPQPCAWRLPGLLASLASALFLHRALVVQSGGEHTREVGWVQSAAMLVRRAAAQRVGYLDPDFFVYSDETDFCKRLRDAGGRILYVPAARAVHHEQLATDREAGRRRLVEFHRNRDLYMRKHHGSVVAAIARALSAWTYGVRALAAVVMPGRDAGWYWAHTRAAMWPERGEGLREAAEKFNESRA